MQPSDVAAELLHLAAIVESSDDAIISKDLNGIVRSFNPAAERMFGYKAEEIIGKSITTLSPPELRHEETEFLARLRRGERIDHYETVRATKSGALLDVALTISPVRDASGTIVGASKIARDVTERKRRTEVAIAEQREWFETTLRSIGDGVIAVDVQARVVFMNPVAEQLTGWSLERAQGRPCDDVFRIVDETTRRLVESPVSRVFRDGSVVGLANQTILIAADGKERPIDDSGAPIRTPEGRVVGAVLVFRDVTERRRVEIEKQEAAAERERLLGRERLARAEAERASGTKDEFVAMVSHELRTPLNAILGWTEVLRRARPGDETLQHGLSVISRNTRAQAQLISDLLDMSRIVAGKLRLDVEPVDLSDSIATCVESVQPSAADKRIALQWHDSGEPLRTVADPQRLQQVLLNLLSNALKFTPDGGRIDVRARRVGGVAEITVQDSGVGIRREDLETIFQRFRQTGTSTTRPHGGLGLGLSISRHLLELHGGSVAATSDGDGRGSTFTVVLPLREVALPAAAPQQVAASESNDQTRFDGLTVLVVEDQADTRELIRVILETRGARALEAASAAEALRLLAAERPDLLLSDIGLPDVDGYELIERVRARADALAAIPAIAVTAFARFEDRTRAIRSGFQAHLAKPVDPTELVVTLGSFARLIAAKRAT